MVTSGHVAQVGAPAERRGARALGLLQRGGGKYLRDVVRVDGDQADRPRVAHRAEPLDDAGRLQAKPVMRQRFGEHDLAVRGAAVLARWDHPFGLGAPVGGNDAPTGVGGASAVDAEHAAWRVGQASHGAAFVARCVPGLDPGIAFSRASTRSPGASAGCPCGSAAMKITGGGPSGHPSRRPGDGVAVRVRPGDHHHGRLRQARVRRRRAKPIGPAGHGGGEE